MSEQSPRRNAPTTSKATVSPAEPATTGRASKAGASSVRAKKTAAKRSPRRASAAKTTAERATTASTKPVPRTGGSLAVGAARASGERRRRTGTPLLVQATQAATDPATAQAFNDSATAPAATPATAPAATPATAPAAAPTTAPAATGSGTGRTALGGAAGATGRQRRSARLAAAEAKPEHVLSTSADAPVMAPPTHSRDAAEPDAAPTQATGSRPTRAAIAEARAKRSRRLAATADGGPALLRSVPTQASSSRAGGDVDVAGAGGPSDTETEADFSTEFTTDFSSDQTTGETDGVDASSAEGREGGAGIAAALQSGAEKLVAKALEATALGSKAAPGPHELVELAVNVLRTAAVSAGLPTDEVEEQVAQGLAYLRRRLTGDYTVDEFGFDEDYTLNVHLPALRPFYRTWFRVETRGIENIPDTGGALLVANHSGTVAFDSLMTQVAVHDEHPQGRHLRMLGADLVFSTPFVGSMARRSGTTLAANSDAQRLLSGGQLVGVWPEGFKGIGKPFTERYKLQRFGRGGFVAAALRAGVPIVPVSIVGAEEIYPILGDVPALARLLGMPYAPVTATWPLLGPLGLIPLPSKWLIEFGPPIDTSSYGPDAAEDPMLVFDLTDQVRETIQQTLYSLLMQRRSVFF